MQRYLLAPANPRHFPDLLMPPPLGRPHLVRCLHIAAIGKIKGTRLYFATSAQQLCFNRNEGLVHTGDNDWLHRMPRRSHRPRNLRCHITKLNLDAINGPAYTTDWTSYGRRKKPAIKEQNNQGNEVISSKRKATNLRKSFF